MADFSLCKNYLCPMSENCDRFTTKPDHYYQSYSEFEPDDDGNCDYFIENKKFKTEEYEGESDF